MSVEIITFKKLGFFSHLLGLFFLLKYSFRRTMLQLEFGESKPEESQSEQSRTETRKATSCSSETLKSNAGSVDRPRPDAPSRTQKIFGKVLYYSNTVNDVEVQYKLHINLFTGT